MTTPHVHEMAPITHGWAPETQLSFGRPMPGEVNVYGGVRITTGRKHEV